MEKVIGTRLTVLGSGSAGNATLLQGVDRHVMIDVGLSCREVTRRLAGIGVSPRDIGAVVITHAHGDHTRGAALFSRKHGVPVHATAAIRAAWRTSDVAAWGDLACETTSEICGFRFTPFDVPHDAEAGTVAFVIETHEGTIGYATDMGAVTPGMRERFRDCRVLVIESNHAVELLRVGPYPQAMKSRISGARGHLSNEALAMFVRDHLGPQAQCLVLAHLSRVNNLPEIAEMTCREALRAAGRDNVRIVVSHQDRVAETVDLGRLARRTETDRT